MTDRRPHDSLAGAGGGTGRRLVAPVLALAALLVPLPSGGAGASTHADAAPAEVCTPALIPFEPEAIRLTGAWSAQDASGAVYYLRQIGDTVWWSGMSGAA